MTTVNLADIEIDEPADSTYYRKWTQRMDAALRIPALFGLDGPGRAHATDMVDLVSVPVLGANDSEEVVEQYGKYLAMNARAVGGNWVWSPNVDLPQRFSGISIMRQLSSDPDRLTRLSLAMIRGAQANGLAMGAKHFPGKDKIEYRDGHFADEIIRTDKQTWLKTQGKVFQDMIDGGVWSIMPGHQAFPAVDNSRINGGAYIPTTLSYKILTKL
jgi:beta-N-acetylhexosaminidase